MAFRVTIALQIATAIFLLTTLACVLRADTGPSLPRLFAPRQSAAPAKPQPKAEPKAEEKLTEIAAEAPTSSEVDTAEIIRRGDRVTRAGRGPMDSGEAALSEATAPPADDSGKWFISILVDDAEPSKALLYDLRHSQALRAWADLDEPKGSWSHATVYRAGDQTQDWRWKNLKITALPCMILQPPAQLVDETRPNSWRWGDPKTVIWQFDGYDTSNPRRAENRAAAIRAALQLYVKKISERQQIVNIGPRSRAVPPPTPGARQAATPGPKQDIGGAPPFQLSPSVQPGGAPVFPADPMGSAVQSAAQDGVLALAGKLLSGVAGNPTTWLMLLAALKVFELVAARTPNKLDDKVAGILSGIASSQKSPTPSA